MTSTQLNELINLFYHQQYAFEKHNARYDIREALMAVGQFKSVCDGIDYKNEDIESYLKQLKIDAEHQRDHMPSYMQGDYSGGSATFGSCYIEFNKLLTSDMSFAQLKSQLIENTQTLDKTPSGDTVLLSANSIEESKPKTVSTPLILGLYIIALLLLFAANS